MVSITGRCDFLIFGTARTDNGKALNDFNCPVTFKVSHQQQHVPLRLFGSDGYNYTPQKTDSPTDKCQPAATQVLPLSILVAVGWEDGRSLIATRKGAKKGDSRKAHSPALSLNLPAPQGKRPFREKCEADQNS